MPRQKKKKRIGMRRKYHYNKTKAASHLDTAVLDVVSPSTSALADHTYASVQPTILDVNIVREKLWVTAWTNFFIDICEDQAEHGEAYNKQEFTDSDNCSADEFFVLVGKMHQYSPDDNLDEIVDGILQHRKYHIFQSLRRGLFDHAEELGRFTVLRCREDSINIVDCYDGDFPSMKFSVILRPFLTASIFVHGRDIGQHHDFWIGLPKYFSTVNDVKRLLSKLSSYNVCVGNYEDKFVNVIPVGVGICVGSSSNISAYRETNFGANSNGISYQSTIRSTRCSFLITDKARCGHCMRYRSTLRSQLRRESMSPKTPPQSTFTHSHKTHKDMSKTELVWKFEQMRNQKNTVEAELRRVKRDVQQGFHQRGHELNPTENSDFTEILRENTHDIQRVHPNEESIPRLFLEQQLKYSKLTDKRSMRWHPMIIKWCLYMRSKSRKGYDTASNSGFISLPSKRTLYDYSHTLPNTLGFHAAYNKHLKEEAKSHGMLDNDARSYVGLLHDEVKVSESLVYDKNTGELVGYVDIEKIGNDLLRIEEALKDTKPQLATTMLVVMVRGIVTDLRYPYAAFATRGITADFLFPIIGDILRMLELLTLKVIFITCDGASPNRKFFTLHSLPGVNNFYWTWHPYAVPDRKLYFISDVPHLLKTTRNCFSNSGSHRKTRDLWKHGHDVSWLHILRFYEENIENALFCKTYKLTRDHIDLTPYSTMKVNLTAQILSSTVANALEDLYGDTVVETVKFIRHMNRFFDCLNTRNLREGVTSRNSDKGEYRSIHDPRLNYLLTEFLDFFKEWEDSVMTRPGDFTLAQRKRMLLSHQTLKGLQISVTSIVECVKFMLNAGAEYVFTHRFNQDPLEEQFGQYRQKGGSNDNPSVYTVKNLFSEMKVIGSSALQPIRGNISNKRRRENRTVDNTPMPRRKQRRLH